MLPAVTNCPPYRFTPSRLLVLSRPLRTLPCPFLCAINLSFNRCDLDSGQFLPVADALVIALAAFHLESELFLSAEVRLHVGGDLGAGNRGRAHSQTALVAHEQDALECVRCAGLRGHALDFERITRRHAILLSTSFNDGVHKFIFPKRDADTTKNVFKCQSSFCRFLLPIGP